MKRLFITMAIFTILLSGCDSSEHTITTTYNITGKVAGIESARYGNYIVFNDGTKLLNFDGIQIKIGETYTFTIEDNKARDFWGHTDWKIISFKIVE